MGPFTLPILGGLVWKVAGTKWSQKFGVSYIRIEGRTFQLLAGRISQTPHMAKKGVSGTCGWIKVPVWSSNRLEGTSNHRTVHRATRKQGTPNTRLYRWKELLFCYGNRFPCHVTPFPRGPSIKVNPCYFQSGCAFICGWDSYPYFH